MLLGIDCSCPCLHFSHSLLLPRVLMCQQSPARRRPSQVCCHQDVGISFLLASWWSAPRPVIRCCLTLTLVNDAINALSLTLFGLLRTGYLGRLGLPRYLLRFLHRFLVADCFLSHSPLIRINSRGNWFQNSREIQPRIHMTSPSSRPHISLLHGMGRSAGSVSAAYI